MIHTRCNIQYFPISFFSVVMGLAGFAIVLQKAVDIFHIPVLISTVADMLTIGVFAIVTGVYALKVARAPHEVKKEFKHPIKLNFFATFSISLVLISIVLLPTHAVLSQYAWMLGAVLHFGLTLAILSIWMHHDRFTITHMNPAWFIPAVGNIIVPVAGVVHASPEISWFFFSYGLLFWLVLLTIFFYRIVFHEALHQKLLPTLFILIAPPAVGSVAYVKLVGHIDAFSRVLYYSALFLTVLMFVQVRVHARIQFYLSWWAYSFPIAAIAIASALMYHMTHVAAYQYIFGALFIVLTALITTLVYRTAIAISKKEICVEE